MSNCLARLSRSNEALDAMEEAVAVLKGPFMSAPTVFGGRMDNAIKKYRQLCEEIGRPPDATLFAPIDARWHDLSTSG